MEQEMVVVDADGQIGGGEVMLLIATLSLKDYVWEDVRLQGYLCIT